MGLLTRFKSAFTGAAIAVACLGVAPTHAAPILIVESGKLIGAKGVTVGSLGEFDVEFTEGSCAALFQGCDEATDFVFRSSADAISASQALLDFVFIDGAAGLFDSQPELTRGCGAVNLCATYTPYELRSDLPAVLVGRSDNYSSASGSSDSVLIDRPDPGFDTGWFGNVTYAVWSRSDSSPSPVSAPGTLALLGVAGLALGWTQRRRPMGVTAQ